MTLKNNKAREKEILIEALRGANMKSLKLFLLLRNERFLEEILWYYLHQHEYCFPDIKSLYGISVENFLRISNRYYYLFDMNTYKDTYEVKKKKFNNLINKRLEVGDIRFILFAHIDDLGYSLTNTLFD